jgi:hypothetical protein
MCHWAKKNALILAAVSYGAISNRRLTMRKLVFCVAVTMTIAPNLAHSQVTVDMTQVTCADYLAMPPDRASMFSAWMNGWYNHKLGYASIGLGDYANNIASIRQWCATFPGETIMSGLDRSRPQQGPPGGQVKIDMSLVTCKQYLSSDRERQELIATWMSGYFHASKGQPVLDFQRFANNKKAVGTYCKKQGGETLMSAIQKSAR